VFVLFSDELKASDRDRTHLDDLCVCVCVCVCARARAPARVHACVCARERFCCLTNAFVSNFPCCNENNVEVAALTMGL
jgi:hypothetical protein